MLRCLGIILRLVPAPTPKVSMDTEVPRDGARSYVDVAAVMRISLQRMRPSAIATTGSYFLHSSRHCTFVQVAVRMLKGVPSRQIAVAPLNVFCISALQCTICC